jgi:hypothetical protein
MNLPVKMGIVLRNWSVMRWLKFNASAEAKPTAQYLLQRSDWKDGREHSQPPQPNLIESTEKNSLRSKKRTDNQITGLFIILGTKRWQEKET